MTAAAWGKIAVVVVLFAGVFWPNLRRLWQKTNPFTGEDNWGHAIVVPIIGLYYLYLHRNELPGVGPLATLPDVPATLPFDGIWGNPLRAHRLYAGLGMLGGGAIVALALASRTGLAETILASFFTAVAILGALVLLADWGIGITLFGLGLYVYGIYPGQNDYLKDMGMIATLFGVVLLACGPGVMRVAWFPIVFLVCAIPWPGLVYSWVAGPLQVLAADVAVGVLKMTGVDAVVSGTKIIMESPTPGGPIRTLNVAEACAGLRSLMTFVSVGAAIAFLSARPLWEKLVITVSSVPIAIGCNVFRISGQGLIDHYWDQGLSEGFAHQFIGLVMLVPAFFLILLVGVVLDRLFIEEIDEADPLVVPLKKPAIVTRASAAVVAPAAIAAPPRGADLARDSQVGIVAGQPVRSLPAAKRVSPTAPAAPAPVGPSTPANTQIPLVRKQPVIKPPVSKPATNTPPKAESPQPVRRPAATRLPPRPRGLTLDTRDALPDPSELPSDLSDAKDQNVTDGDHA